MRAVPTGSCCTCWAWCCQTGGWAGPVGAGLGCGVVMVHGGQARRRSGQAGRLGVVAAPSRPAPVGRHAQGEEGRGAAGAGGLRHSLPLQLERLAGAPPRRPCMLPLGGCLLPAPPVYGGPVAASLAHLLWLPIWYPVARTRAPQALQSVCGDLATVGQLSLPNHFTRTFFLASACVDMQHNAEALQHLQVGGSVHAGCTRGGGCARQHCAVPALSMSRTFTSALVPRPHQGLAAEFPRSDAVIQLAALAHYNLQVGGWVQPKGGCCCCAAAAQTRVLGVPGRSAHPPWPLPQNFDEAQELFEELLQLDPHRIEVRCAARPPAPCVPCTRAGPATRRRCAAPGVPIKQWLTCAPCYASRRAWTSIQTSCMSRKSLRRCLRWPTAAPPPTSTASSAAASPATTTRCGGLRGRLHGGWIPGAAQQAASAAPPPPDAAPPRPTPRSGMHERAVQYFRRALRLNPAYLSAWTLMGHEYVELKNPPAAIGGRGWGEARGGEGSPDPDAWGGHRGRLAWCPPPCLRPRLRAARHRPPRPTPARRGVPAGGGRQPARLPGVVRAGSDIRAGQHALLRTLLLPQVRRVCVGCVVDYEGMVVRAGKVVCVCVVAGTPCRHARRPRVCNALAPWLPPRCAGRCSCARTMRACGMRWGTATSRSSWGCWMPPSGATAARCRMTRKGWRCTSW